MTPEQRKIYIGTSLVAWSVTFGSLLASSAIIGLTNLSYDLDEFFLHGLIGVCLLPVVLVYSWLRSDAIILTVSDTVALLGLAPLCCGLLIPTTTYLGGAFPFWDQELQRMDEAFRFDWLADLSWMTGQPTITAILGLAYASIPAQMALVFVFVILTRAYGRLQVFFLAVQFALVGSCVLAMLFPTLGPYWLLNISPEVHHPNVSLVTMNNHVPYVLALRTPGAVLPQSDPVGLITFPSVHTVLAILFAWFFWARPGWRWVGLVANVAMLAATPLWGSHYLMDMLAGTALALACLAGAKGVRSAIEARVLAGRGPAAQAEPRRLPLRKPPERGRGISSRPPADPVADALLFAAEARSPRQGSRS